MTPTQAEAEIVEALWKHARTLRHAKHPRLAIAAAQWEIRLEAELDKLKPGSRTDKPVVAATAADRADVALAAEGPAKYPAKR